MSIKVCNAGSLNIKGDPMVDGSSTSGAPAATNGPSATPPGSPPTGTTSGTGLCCACPASGQVDTIGDTDYFSCDYNPGWYINNLCQISLTRTKTGGTVTIAKTFALSYANGATAANDAGTVTSAIQSAMSGWTAGAASWRIEITQPGCDVQKLAMQFTSTIVTSGADVNVTADGKVPVILPDGTPEYLLSYVTGGIDMQFYLNSGGNIPWTMIHEVGHTFGLPDEYTYDRTAATPAPTCTYKGATDPDKTITLSTSVIQPTPGQFAFDNNTVMGQDTNTNYPDYLFYWVAIEVQKIMADNGVTADVKVVAP